MKHDYIIVRRTRPDGDTRGGLEGFESSNLEVDLGTNGQVNLETATIDPKEARDLKRDPEVEQVVRSMPLRLIEPFELGDGQPVVRSDETDEVTWGIRAVGADRPDYKYKGEGIKVAVLDTGINLDHPAFAPIRDRVVYKNFTKETDADIKGHGTHCAGTIFGQSVDGKRIGVAPNIEKAIIGKVLGNGGGQSKDIADAIQWAIAEGANVISMSLGFNFNAHVKYLEKVEKMPREVATSTALQDYVANLELFNNLGDYVSNNGRGVESILIAAAGNESRVHDDPAFKIKVAAPAAAKGFFSVAALAQEGERFRVASFSNVGARVAGPGVEVYSADAHGQGLVTKSGTSMAAPHVAGVAALWAQKLQEGRKLSAKLLTSKLEAAAVDSRIEGYEPMDIGGGMVQAPID